MGPKDDCLLVSLRLDPFCDTTKVGVLPSFVAKIVGNNYCTDTSVQPVIIIVQECSIGVCSFREPE